MSTNKQEYSKNYYLKNKEKIKLHTRKNRDKYPRKNPEKYKEYMREYSRKYHLKSKYGLTLVEFEETIKKQNGLCGICCNPLINPVIDHDHITGKIRGLLCHGCNLILGFSKDNVNILEKAIEYVKAFKEKLQ